MKTLIIAHKCKWKSWDAKIQELKDWWMPEVNLEITLEHKDFDDIPWIDYMMYKDSMFRGISFSWFDTNIVQPALQRGFDCVIFTVASKDWKGTGAWGWNSHNNLGVQEIHISGYENKKYGFEDMQYEGDHWFNVARHEISHALYRSRGIVDNTHKYWATGNLEEVKKELRLGFMSHPLVLSFQRILNPVKSSKWFNQNEVEGLLKEFVLVLDSIREAYGKPIVITSGKRLTGNHATGLAVDIPSTGGKFLAMVTFLRNAKLSGKQIYQIYKIMPKNAYPDDDQYQLVKSAIDNNIKRIGVYNRHTHLDMVQGKSEPTIWFGVSK